MCPHCSHVIAITFHRSTILNFTQFSRHFRLQSAISQSILLSYAAVAGVNAPYTGVHRGRRIALFPAQFRHHRKVSVNQRLNEFAPFPACSIRGSSRDLLSWLSLRVAEIRLSCLTCPTGVTEGWVVVADRRGPGSCR